LQLKGGEAGKISITVFAADGKTVHTETGEQKNYIFGEAFVPGMYTVRILQNGFTKTIKIIKTR
jgi:hypothetical protein